MIKKLFLKKALFAICFFSIATFAQNGLYFNSNPIVSPQDNVTSSFYGVPGSNARTIEAWIKRGNTGTSQQIIAEIGSGANPGGRFTFKIMNNHLVLETGGSTSGIANLIEGSTLINSTTLWYHVAATVTPINATTATVRIYLNGTLEGMKNFSVNTANTVGLQIGGRTINLSATAFLGVIDELRYWDVALTQVQISEYKDKSICAQAGLMLYYKMDEGIANADNTTITQISDNSGNGFIGTLNGFALTGTTSNFVNGALIGLISFDTTVNSSNNTLTVAETSPTATFQWVVCNNANAPIIDETNASFTPTIAGNYAVIVTKGGCSSTSACNQITLSTNNFELENQIKLYPNPSKGVFNLAFGTLFETVKVTVTNTAGQIIEERNSFNSTDLQLNLNDAPSGIYFVNVVIDNAFSKTFKIINE